MRRRNRCKGSERRRTEIDKKKKNSTLGYQALADIMAGFEMCLMIQRPEPVRLCKQKPGASMKERNLIAVAANVCLLI